ncbi:MAG: hypothetical protein ABSB19_13755 [Methylomonas sp.]|jgi:hypothetical protein
MNKKALKLKLSYLALAAASANWIVAPAMADADGDAAGTTYTYNYNVNVPYTDPTGFNVSVVNLTEINDSNTVAGTINDGYNNFIFVNNTVVSYDGTLTLNGLNDSGAIIGNDNTAEFYSTSSNYTSSAPTAGVAALADAYPTYAGITNNGTVYGSANPLPGEGYTFLFTYNVANQTYQKAELPFLTSACGATQGSVSVQITAVSSNGVWVGGAYTDNDGSFGDFGYNTLTQQYIKFNRTTPNATVVNSNVTGINNSGVAVGTTTTTNATYGYAYNVAGQFWVNKQITDPKASGGGTYVTGINNNGVIVGNSTAVNTAEPGSPNYVFIATPH